MKTGDYLVCHTEMSGVPSGVNSCKEVILSLNKKYKILHIYDYRENQNEYFHFLFVEVESNNGQIEFINYEYKNYLCSIKKFRKKKLDNLKNIL